MKKAIILLLCAALTAGGFLLARWLRRKYRTA